MIEYRPILGFPDYLISNRGYVISTRTGKTRQKKAVKTRLGYMGIKMTDPDGRACNFLVHRLVLETFVGPCPQGMETRHLNGIRDDNQLTNLVWGTKIENVQDKRRHGTFNPPVPKYGENCSYAKLTLAQVNEIFSSEKKGRELAKIYGVSEGSISRIRTGKGWVHARSAI